MGATPCTAPSAESRQHMKQDSTTTSAGRLLATTSSELHGRAATAAPAELQHGSRAHLRVDDRVGLQCSLDVAVVPECLEPVLEVPLHSAFEAVLPLGTLLPPQGAQLVVADVVPPVHEHQGQAAQQGSRVGSACQGRANIVELPEAGQAGLPGRPDGLVTGSRVRRREPSPQPGFLHPHGQLPAGLPGKSLVCADQHLSCSLMALRWQQLCTQVVS